MRATVESDGGRIDLDLSACFLDNLRSLDVALRVLRSPPAPPDTTIGQLAPLQVRVPGYDDVFEIVGNVGTESETEMNFVLTAGYPMPAVVPGTVDVLWCRGIERSLCTLPCRIEPAG